MKFNSPNGNIVYQISAMPDWPSLQFETDASGPHTWEWEIYWGSFRHSGQTTTDGNQWDASTAVANYGGTLTVRALAGNDQTSVTVSLVGDNPSAADVIAYLTSQPDSAGFDKIVEHESGFKHFTDKNQPCKSFDNGYGLCQLTMPVPTFEQVWNWKLNLEGGLKLFASKVAEAKTFLSQSGRTYTADQLKYEAVSRWNGGSYHQWDTTAGAWVRKRNILCDTATGNIGWDMSEPENAGMTEADLHKRDAAAYRSPPKSTSHWGYFGVCYADRILG